MKIQLQPSINQYIPNFKIGFIFYKNIVVDDSPSMLKGRLDFFQEKITADLNEQTVFDYQGVSEWRDIFKNIEMNPNRYQPSHEALFRQIANGKRLPFINSAVDLNNFFSLQYEIPIGLYNLDAIKDYIKISLGSKNSQLEGINKQMKNMEGMLVAADIAGPFGSPIADSYRTKVDETTTNALQIFYLKESLPLKECKQLLQSAATMFKQLHSGNSITSLLHRGLIEKEVPLS